MRRLTPLLAVPISLVLAGPAPASSVTVPDQYASIQAAIDSGADTVLVRYGTYPEALSITRVLALIALPTQEGDRLKNLLPRVTRLRAQGSYPSGPALLVRGFEVTGGASVGGFHYVYLEGCRFDSSMTCNAGSFAHLWNSTVFGSADVVSIAADIAMNTIIGGTLSGYSAGAFDIHENVVIGPAAVGIYGGEDVMVSRNYVKDCTNGIHAGYRFGSYLDGNVVEDCSGTGYDGTGTPLGGGNHITNNIARRCGQRGFDLAAIGMYVVGNTVDSTGQEGIRGLSVFDELRDNTVTRAGSTGISAQTVLHAAGNHVIGSGGDGIALQGAQDVQGNIVGRSGGRGLVVTSGLNNVRAVNNTSYLNLGAGFDITGNAPDDSIVANISHGNAVGLRWNGSGAPFLGCNDWYGNGGGNVIGVAEGASDTTLNPLFCDLPNDDVSLSAVSALANLPGCGQVGALGVGCPYPAAVEWRPGDTRLGLEVAPQPGHGAIRLSWRAPEAPGEIAVYDAAGALRWKKPFEAGAAATTWDTTDLEGRPLPAGVYFARLTTAVGQATTRVVVLR